MSWRAASGRWSSKNAGVDITRLCDGIDLISETGRYQYLLDGKDALPASRSFARRSPQDVSGMALSAWLHGIGRLPVKSLSMIGVSNVTLAGTRNVATSVLPRASKLRSEPRAAARQGGGREPVAHPVLRGT